MKLPTDKKFPFCLAEKKNIVIFEPGFIPIMNPGSFL